MNKKLHQSILIATCAALGSGCAASLDIISPSPLGDGVRGKTWRTPAFADELLFPKTSYTTSNLVNSWDVAKYGSTAQLVATWHDPAQTFHKGFARQYIDGTGGAALGPLFGVIASDTTNDIGYCSVAAGPGGMFMANFINATVTGRAASSLFTGAAWQPFSVATTMPVLSHADYDSTADQIAPRAKSLFDKIGRGYVFFVNDSGAGQVYYSSWESAGTNGIDPAAVSMSGAADAAANIITPQSPFTAIFDGSKYVCVTYELNATSALRSRCVDATDQSAIDFTAAPMATVSTDLMAGHDTATDGAGKIMAVFYQTDGTNYRTYASLFSNAAWSTPVAIDGATTSTYMSPSPTGGTAPLPGARPGITYVGSGRYLAVWVGLTPSSSPKTTALISATYDPSTGWGAAAVIPGTPEAYYTTPHPQALTVFGNGNNNAGYALNKIYTDQTSSSISGSVYQESFGVRVTQVARWHKDNGWLTVTNTGNYCYNFSGTAGFPASIGSGTLDGVCSHPPVALMFSSGNSIVFYGDRDDYTSATSTGNRRISAIEFK